MKFEAENPTLVKVLGAVVATAIVIIGAKLLPDELAWFTGVAGTVLGAVGVQVNKREHPEARGDGSVRGGAILPSEAFRRRPSRAVVRRRSGRRAPAHQGRP